MIPHFFFEFNADPDVIVIYAGLACKSGNMNFMNLHPNNLSKYMNKVGNSRTKFCFDNLFEGNITPMIDIIYRSLAESSINPLQCNYFSGAMDSIELHNKYCIDHDIVDRINVYSCNTWEYSLRKESQIRDSEYVIGKKEKTVLCFNRILRPHRLALLSLMHEKDLLKNSYYSFFEDATHDLGKVDLSFMYGNIQQHVSTDLYERIVKNYESVRKSLPLKLNIEWKENINYIKSIDLELFQNSHLSLVTETYFFPFYHEGNICDGESIFFSEKIFKPIIMKHPFMLVSRPRGLEMLRRIGFKTFSPFVDETYDKIEDDGERLAAIVSEVERLNNFSDDQWHEWQISIEEIVEHNHKVITDRKKYMYPFTRPNHENQY